MYLIWDLSTSGLEEFKGNVFFEVGQGGQQVLVGFIKFPKRLWGGGGVATVYV